MTGIVRFIDVTKRFGPLVVLDRFNFSVRAGEKVTLIGPSGSGKSTVLRILMTLEPFQEEASKRRVSNTMNQTARARSALAKATSATFAQTLAWYFRVSICFPT